MGPGMCTKGVRCEVNAPRVRGTRVAQGLQRPTLSLETQMTLNPDRIGELVVRMQGDFLDAPTLTLRLPDAERRFGVTRITCEAGLGALVDSQVLARTRDGAYVRFFPRLAQAA